MAKTSDSNVVSEADALRTPDNACNPDPRVFSFVRIDSSFENHQSDTIQDQFDAVSRLELAEYVPLDIRVQFETTKNLYLYAWFVFRFYPVAQHHALTCLELALKTRYSEEIPKKYYKNSKQPMLRSLLQYAVDKGDISQEGFSSWKHHAELRARSRYELEKLQEMNKKGLDSIPLDYLTVEITDEDKNWGFLESTLSNIVNLRNHYAHGSSMLSKSVFGKIEIVSEIINQVFHDMG